MIHKPFKSIDEQVGIIKDRGLIVNDEATLRLALRNLNYYRLDGYTLALRKENTFYKDTSFEDVMQIYNFDKELKLKFLGYLEEIEIALRL